MPPTGLITSLRFLSTSVKRVPEPLSAEATIPMAPAAVQKTRRDLISDPEEEAVLEVGGTRAPRELAKNRGKKHVRKRGS